MVSNMDESVVHKTKGSNNMMEKVFKEFTLMWLLTAIGIAVGRFTPEEVGVIAGVLSLVLIVSTIFIRKVKTVNGIYYTIPFLLGIGLFYTLNMYQETSGGTVVIATFIGTAILFATLGVIGYYGVKKDLAPMGFYLFGLLLIGLFLVIIGLFITSSIAHIVISGFIVMVFVLYTVYDFNQIRHADLEPDDTVRVAFSLYLDFLNLFRHILEILFRSALDS